MRYGTLAATCMFEAGGNIVLRFCACIALVVIPLLSFAQAPFVGPPAGSGSNPMESFMERVAIGVIEDLNPILGYIQIGVPGRGSRIAVVGEGTVITRAAEVPRTELKVGDEVTVSGTPTALAAEKVQIGPELTMMDIFRALQEEAPPSGPSGSTAATAEGRTSETSGQGGAPPPQPAPPTGPGGSFGIGPPGGPAPLSFTVSGKVKSVDPLVITLTPGGDVAVELPEHAKVVRRSEADLTAAVVQEPIVAIGELNEDGYLAARRVYLGESVSMGRSSFGRGRGPTGAFFGAPGGLPPMGGQGQ